MKYNSSAAKVGVWIRAAERNPQSWDLPGKRGANLGYDPSGPRAARGLGRRAETPGAAHPKVSRSRSACAALARVDQTFSKMTAMPWPPPTHMVARQYLPLMRFIS